MKLLVLAARPSHMQVAVAGLTNTYSSYITTVEEYAVQRYEGASTAYGPHTLAAYTQVGARAVCVLCGE
jgi:neutral ceramidase